MTETLKRLREPVAITVLLLGVLWIVVWGVHLVSYAREPGSSLPLAALATGSSILNVGWVLALVAAVCSCFLVKPTTPQAARVVLAGAVVVTSATALGLISLLIGLTAGQVGTITKSLTAVGAFLELGLKGLAAYLLWKVHAAAPNPQVGIGEVTQAAHSAAIFAEPAPDTAVKPVWTVEEAVGVEWTRAGDAASGAKANRLSLPSLSTGAEAGAAELPPALAAWAAGRQNSPAAIESGTPVDNQPTAGDPRFPKMKG